jgi:site-specific DNA-cytosine methylase
MVLSSIDLFTGIGGITLALKGIAHPILYCDNAPECNLVLNRLMDKGKLPTCPISDNVKTLNRAWLKRHGINQKPDIIVGGFPCTSVSTLGNKDGFKNVEDGSGLFFEILRLADELHTPLLFLENVQNILNMEMSAIVRELVHKRGYNIRWCVNSAKNMGSGHQRKRWFCLAYKDAYARQHPALDVNEAYKAFNWNEEREPERTVCENKPAANRKIYMRHGMLGNSVVPDCVRYAFFYLWNGMQNSPVNYTTPSTIRIDRPIESSKSELIVNTDMEWTSCGYVLSREPFTLHKKVFLKPDINPKRSYKRTLVFDSRTYKSKVPPGKNLTCDFLTEPDIHPSWTTARHGATRASNYLTTRTVRDLPTQVRFERGTTNRGCPMNPFWTEFLMGYERNWTSF